MSHIWMLRPGKQFVSLTFLLQPVETDAMKKVYIDYGNNACKEKKNITKFFIPIWKLHIILKAWFHMLEPLALCKMHKQY